MVSRSHYRFQEFWAWYLSSLLLDFLQFVTARWSWLEANFPQHLVSVISVHQHQESTAHLACGCDCGCGCGCDCDCGCGCVVVVAVVGCIEIGLQFSPTPGVPTRSASVAFPHPGHVSIELDDTVVAYINPHDVRAHHGEPYLLAMN
jgi:hypothetical protein